VHERGEEIGDEFVRSLLLERNFEKMGSFDSTPPSPTRRPDSSVTRHDAQVKKEVKMVLKTSDQLR
jgi:hypothetical protein